MGTLYRLLGRTFNYGCNNCIVPKDINEEDNIPIVPRDKTMQWHKKLGQVGEKGLQTLHGKCMVEGMFDFSSEFDLCEHFIYAE